MSSQRQSAVPPADGIVDRAGPPSPVEVAVAIIGGATALGEGADPLANDQWLRAVLLGWDALAPIRNRSAATATTPHPVDLTPSLDISVPPHSYG